MNENPFFSVIIPTYNRASFIRRTIKSVLIQSYSSFELIIVDDGSTDNTEEVVKKFTDSRIKYFKIKNSERGAARNFGMNQTNAKYITFLDSDDIYYRNYLHNALTCIEKHSSPPFLHLRYETRNENGRIPFFHIPLKDDDTSCLIDGNRLSCMGIFLRKDITDNFKFREERELAGSEDWELWMRLIANFGLKVDNNINACMINHDSRSVMHAIEQNLIKRKELALKYAFSDLKTKEVFINDYNKIDAFLDTYISLHLVLAFNNKASIRYFLRAIKTYPLAFLSKRAFAIVKHLFLNSTIYLLKEHQTQFLSPTITLKNSVATTIELVDPETKSQLIQKEDGLYSDGKIKYIFSKGYYQIAPLENYTSNFGFQWNKFVKTQIDKFNGFDFTYQRFFNVTEWDNEDLTGQNILEVGCGAGRFTQIVLDYTDAKLYSLDYSNAVAANFINNGPNERLRLFQASIYQMPFKPDAFNKVFCFGVLQHTPDIEQSIQCMIDMVKPGGELIIDFYPYKGFWTKINAKYLLRPFLKKLSQEKLLKIITKNVDWMIFLSKTLVACRLNFLTRFIPLCDIHATFPQRLSNTELKEWAILDTFDMFSPAYDQPQKIKTIKKIFIEKGMRDVWGGYKYYGSNLEVAVVKGIKK